MLTFQLGSGSTFTATVNTGGDTVSTNQFDTLGGPGEHPATPTSAPRRPQRSAAATLTLTSNDLTNNFTVSGGASADINAARISPTPLRASMPQ